MDCVLCEVFLVLSLHLYFPFRVVDVVCGDICVVFLGYAGFGESNGAVVGSLHVSAECRAVETVVDLVEWVVIDVRTADFSRGSGRFVWCGWVASMSACGLVMHC